MWLFLTLPILLLVNFGADLFWCKFHENYLLVLLFSIFLIYKKIFFCLSVFFQKQSKDFLFICNEFLSTPHKKYKFQTRHYCFFFIRLFQ